MSTNKTEDSSTINWQYTPSTTTDNTLFVDSTTDNLIYVNPGSSTGDGIILSQPHNYGSVLSVNGPSNVQKFDVPREDMPVSVFSAGRMLTIGIIGSDAEVCFMGDHLRFKPGVICMAFNDKSTLSLEYKDEIYHYNLHNTHQDDLEGDLISVVQK